MNNLGLVKSARSVFLEKEVMVYTPQHKQASENCHRLLPVYHPKTSQLLRALGEVQDSLEEYPLLQTATMML